MQWPRARALGVAGGLLLSGAGLHLVAAYEPEHLEKGLFFGFFWAATIVQGTLAVLLLRITRLASAVGFGVNAFLVILWTATRLVPLPRRRREPHVPQEVGAALLSHRLVHRDEGGAAGDLSEHVRPRGRHDGRL